MPKQNPDNRNPMDAWPRGHSNQYRKPARGNPPVQPPQPNGKRGQQ